MNSDDDPARAAEAARAKRKLVLLWAGLLLVPGLVVGGLLEAIAFFVDWIGAPFPTGGVLALILTVVSPGAAYWIGFAVRRMAMLGAIRHGTAGVVAMFLLYIVINGLLAWAFLSMGRGWVEMLKI